MRSTSLSEIDESVKFVLRAAEWFTNHPEHQTYGGTESGQLFATRWGFSQDCILVLKIDPNTETVLYQQAIDGEILTVPMKSYGIANDKARPRKAGD